MVHQPNKLWDWIQVQLGEVRVGGKGLLGTTKQPPRHWKGQEVPLQDPYNYIEGWFRNQVAHHEADNVNTTQSMIQPVVWMCSVWWGSSSMSPPIISPCPCVTVVKHQLTRGGVKSSIYLHLAMFHFHKYTLWSSHWLVSFTFPVNHCIHSNIYLL